MIEEAFEEDPVGGGCLSRVLEMRELVFPGQTET